MALKVYETAFDTHFAVEVDHADRLWFFTNGHKKLIEPLLKRLSSERGIRPIARASYPTEGDSKAYTVVVLLDGDPDDELFVDQAWRQAFMHAVTEAVE